MIPALAEQHFTERGGDMYRVAVIPATTPSASCIDRRPRQPRCRQARISPLRPFPAPPRGWPPRRPRGERSRPRKRRPPLASAGSAPERIARRRGRHDSAAQSRHQLRRPAATDVCSRDAGSYLAPRRKARAAADGVRRRCIARTAHACGRDRSAAENLASGVVSGDRVKRYGQMIEGRVAPARRHGRARAPVRRHRVGLQYRRARPAVAARDHRVRGGSALPLVGPAKSRCTRDRAGSARRHRRCHGAPLRGAEPRGECGQVRRTRPLGRGPRPARSQRRRSEVRITVSDHGPGIPPPICRTSSSRSTAAPTPSNGRFTAAVSA